MNKKLIISNSLTFLFVVIFVALFKSIFGSENTLIGVTTITALLMFLSKDLTISPIRNSIRLVMFNLFIGVCSVLAVSNIYIGIIANFIALFVISYTLCYNLETPMYFPFTLQYLFLLASPVSIDQLPRRFIALIFGALFIILAQLITNKNRISKSGNKILISICNTLISKIKLFKGEFEEDFKIDIQSNINAFRKMVYDKREFDFYLTEEGRIKLNLSVALENIYTMIDVVNKSEDVVYILDNIEKLIIDTKNILKGKEINVDLHKSIDIFLAEYENKNINDLITLQLLDSMIILNDTLNELKDLKEEHYNLINYIENIPKDKKYGLFRYITKDYKSLRFCYAIRVAITITIAAFITNLFKLSEGKWLLFTILSLLNPIYEVSKEKLKYRLLSTTIGSILVFILFSIFKDTTSRGLILMLSGYINSYLKQYKYTTIFVTISAVGAAALLGDVNTFIVYRILLVALGTIIALLANKFIFPYKLKDSNEELQKMHRDAVLEMIIEIQNIAKGVKKPHSIKNLLITTSLIEERLKLNNQILDFSYYEQLVKEQRFLVTNIYELYIWIVREKVNPEYVKYVLEDIKKLINYKNDPIENTIHEIKEHIKVIKDIKTKITLSSIAIILKELDKITDIKKSI